MTIDIFNTDKKYNILYVDPPWAYKWGKGKNGGNFAPEKHYPTMSIDDICKMKSTIKKIADKNCALLLWTTMPCLPDAMKLIEEWGFKYKTCAFTWVKVKKDGQPLAGMGSYTKSNVEICLLAMRGHIKSADKTVRQIITAQRQGHSVKPFETRDRIVKLFGDLPRIELFARQKVSGWDCWGNEVC
ncbi:MAG: MT-A70 family methyltransferase [Acutalibacteraceae bacterium]|nr:MT-A70 family methyltransferase [Acutalibacteraceae bacterium]